MKREERAYEVPAWQLLHEHSPLLDLLIRPLVLATMVGCVAYAIVEFLAFFMPVPMRYFVTAAVIGGAAGYYVHRLTRMFIPSEAERRRLRLLLLILVCPPVKAAGYLGQPWSAVVVDVQGWFLRPYEFFDGRSLTAFLFFLLAWVVVAQTAMDFGRIGLRTQDRAETPPLWSLSERFFVGGGILLLTSGLARIGVAALLNLARPPVPGLIFNALLYFALGLLLLGQTRLLTLFSRWRAQHVEISDELTERWLRYTLIFLGLVVAVAFLLPTGYTVPLLDLAGWLLWIFWLILGFLIFLFNLLLFPFTWLLALFTKDPVQLPELSAPQQAPPPLLEEGGGMPPWLRVLRSLLFWGVLLWILFTLIRNTLQEHPELGKALRQVGLWRLLRRWMQAIWRWLRKMGDSVQETFPRLGLRERLRRVGRLRGRLGAQHPGPTTPRERVLREYLHTLERAAEEGLPRRPPQTPEEYRRTLGPELPEVEDDVSSLTASFVEARYSQRAWDAGAADRVRDVARRVRSALEHRGEARDEPGSHR